MTNTVLLIGASGFLGSALWQLFPVEWEVWGTGYSWNRNFPSGSDLSQVRAGNPAKKIFLDITNREQVREVIEHLNPQIIILSAALADIDRCETERDLAVKTNVLGAENIARCCQNRLLIYYSTNAVFDGCSGNKGNYREEDQPQPINFYGETKVQAENIIKKLPRHLILRTVMLYTDQQGGPKFINWLIRNLSEGKVVNAATDFVMNPTFIPDLATATVTLVQKKRQGIYHVGGSSSLSCYEMAQHIIPQWGFNPALVQPVRRAELPWKAMRPEDATLNIEKLKAEGITMSTFEQGMEKVWAAAQRWSKQHTKIKS